MAGKNMVFVWCSYSGYVVLGVTRQQFYTNRSIHGNSKIWK